VSPKEVKKEIKKLVYEKPVLIGLGDTLNLGLGAGCRSGSYDAGTCNVGHSATACQPTGMAAINSCKTGTWGA
jgi:hypothetical protein